MVAKVWPYQKTSKIIIIMVLIKMIDNLWFIGKTRRSQKFHRSARGRWGFSVHRSGVKTWPVMDLWDGVRMEEGDLGTRLMEFRPVGGSVVCTSHCAVVRTLLILYRCTAGPHGQGSKADTDKCSELESIQI